MKEKNRKKRKNHGRHFETINVSSLTLLIAVWSMIVCRADFVRCCSLWLVYFLHWKSKDLKIIAIFFYTEKKPSIFIFVLCRLINHPVILKKKFLPFLLSFGPVFVQLKSHIFFCASKIHICCCCCFWLLFFYFHWIFNLSFLHVVKRWAVSVRTLNAWIMLTHAIAWVLQKFMKFNWNSGIK